jgi:outer membrane biosynthesis protein TonB
MMEKEKQRRKVGFAVLISLLLHLVVGYSLAAFGHVLTPALPVEEAPAELTLMDLTEAPPPAPKNPQFIETEPSKESAEKPDEQTFESNANSKAASQLPAAGNLPVPTQDGPERPFTKLDTHDYSLPTQGTQPQPQPKETPQPEVKPTAATTASPKSQPSEPPKSTPDLSPPPTPEPEQLAMLTSTPPPPLKAPEEAEPSPPPETDASAAPLAPRPKPETPASSYQSQKQQTKSAGSITNRGPSAVNAVGTPLGRYQKQMYDAVGARWYKHTAEKRDLISIGTTRLTFTVDRSGRVANLKVVENTANEAFAVVCLQSVQELKLPPIPPDVASTLPPEGLQQELTFILYGN